MFECILVNAQHIPWDSVTVIAVHLYPLFSNFKHLHSLQKIFGGRSHPFQWEIKSVKNPFAVKSCPLPPENNHIFSWNTHVFDVHRLSQRSVYAFCFSGSGPLSASLDVLWDQSYSAQFRWFWFWNRNDQKYIILTPGISEVEFVYEW